MVVSVADYVMDEDRERFRERVLPAVARTAGGRGNAIQEYEDRRAGPYVAIHIFRYRAWNEPPDRPGDDLPGHD